MSVLQGVPLLYTAPLLQGDPTGFSSWQGQLVIAAILLTVIILAVRRLWNQRKR